MYSTSQVPQTEHKSSRRDLCKIRAFHVFMEDIHMYKISGFHISTWGEASTKD